MHVNIGICRNLFYFFSLFSSHRSVFLVYSNSLLTDEILGRYPLQSKQAETLYQDKTKQTFEDNVFVGFSDAMLNHILFKGRLEVAEI